MVTFAITIYLIGHQSRFRTPLLLVLEKIMTMDAGITVNAIIQKPKSPFKCHNGPATQSPTPFGKVWVVNRWGRGSTDSASSTPTRVLLLPFLPIYTRLYTQIKF